MRKWIIVLLVLCLADLAAAAPLVYTGHTFTFSKAGFADPLNPANQDLIVGGVAITRANTGGLFNAAVEQAFAHNSSPAGTMWAFKNSNPDQTVNADNWASLVFEDWETSLGGATMLATNILDGNAVVHLVDQDIYLDLRFTGWGVGIGGGGSFAYERAAITPSADFDRDGDVDGRDLLIWQRGHGVADPLQLAGDANFDGIVNDSDLAVWQENYGGAPAALSAVPEPDCMLLGMISAVGMALLNRHRLLVA